MKAPATVQVLWLLAGFASAGTCSATTLWQVWQQAQTHAPALERAEATLAQARAAHSAALAQLLPALNLNASRIVNNQSLSGPQFYGSGIVPVTQSVNTRTDGWDLQLDQPLFDWQAMQSLSATDRAEAAGVARAEAARQTLMATIAGDYLAVLNAAAQFQATREAEQGFAVQASQSVARYRAGISGIIGSDETEAALAQAQAETLAAEAVLRQARRVLNTDAGVPIPGPFPTLPATITVRAPMDTSEATWLKQALSQNPALAAARLSVQSTEHTLSATRGGYLPTVSLVLSHQRNFVIGNQDFAVPGSAVAAPATQDASQNLIGVELTWPLFSGGATVAASESAEAEERLADAALRTTALQVTRDVRQALDGLRTDSRRVHQLRTGITSARSAVTATAAAVAKGLRTEQDLVLARQTLLALTTTYNSALVQLVNDRLTLARATGVLTPGLLGRVSRHLASSAPVTASPDHPPPENSFHEPGKRH